VPATTVEVAVRLYYQNLVTNVVLPDCKLVKIVQEMEMSCVSNAPAVAKVIMKIVEAAVVQENLYAAGVAVLVQNIVHYAVARVMKRGFTLAKYVVKQERSLVLKEEIV